ncbi:MULTISPECIES: hypothetical protein [Bradyrhizobium]|uniref:hypothetical protein n=1 Tax=Bradyrhizobium TaxID=374 RepID=UPI00040F84FF|nr:MULTISPECIES: hypothetical protein [Bradyrhizobium]UFW51546.1 hypothetical protein BaraCB756_11480 [Bradyrhizobium arachidis]
MSDKHAIEVFQDLSILGPETRRAELREALIAAAATPWERGIDAEKDLSRMARGDDVLVYQRQSDKSLPAARLTLWSREGGYTITNIVPRELDRLTYTQCNGLLQEFERLIAKPAAFDRLRRRTLFSPAVP